MEPSEAKAMPARWTVWRQDDNGNQYEVSRHDTRAEADSVAATMEARGHKQLHHIARPHDAPPLI